MISAVLIAYNEEKNIEPCLASVSWADEIILLDSYSQDKTCQIAQKFGAKVFQREFTNYADQKNAAISHATGDWVFLIDADERVTPELAEEIQTTVRGNSSLSLYAVRRQTYFLQRRLRFSGTQEDKPIRLFPRQKAVFDQPVHEVIKSDLPIKILRSLLIHHTTQTMEQYRVKLDKYIKFEIEYMRSQKRNITFLDLCLRSPAKFFYLFILKLGILDGITGLKFSWLAGYYDFIKFYRYFRESKN